MSQLDFPTLLMWTVTGGLALVVFYAAALYAIQRHWL
jgi:hypothetical protein